MCRLWDPHRIYFAQYRFYCHNIFIHTSLENSRGGTLANRHFYDDGTLNLHRLRFDIMKFLDNVRIYGRSDDDIINTYSNVTPELKREVGCPPSLDRIIGHISKEFGVPVSKAQLGEIRQQSKMPFTDYATINEFIAAKHDIPSQGIPINIVGICLRESSGSNADKATGKGICYDLVIFTDVYGSILNQSHETCGLGSQLSRFLNNGKDEWDFCRGPFVLPDTPYLIRPFIPQERYWSRFTDDPAFQRV